MKDTKITEKTTKQGLINVLKEAKSTDKNLMERVQYALKAFAKDMTKVSKKDLFDLATEVLSATPAPVEASLKPKKKAPSKKTAPKAVEPEEVEEEEPEEEAEEEVAPKKQTKAKKSTKKSSPKKDKEAIETVPPASNVGEDNLPMAKMFPKEIDHPELGKIVACTGAYTTYKEILDALNADKTLYFACYWTKKQIRKYQYAEAKMVNPETCKNGFPLDLDILMAVLPCETMERVFAMSRITEALFQFEGEDFKPIEDTDPRSGDKFQVRVSAGMEFEIYRPADEDIYESSDEEEDEE